jgi:hypothetical protein
LTLPAFDHGNAKGLRGPDYKVGPRCSNPECERWSDHAHHIVRRSALGGDFPWVEVEEIIVGNLTGVCWNCHNRLTGEVGGHKAAIRWIDGIFVWCALAGPINGQIVYVPTGPIQPQPPTPETLARASGRTPQESDVCPTCGQHKRRRPPSLPPGGRRRRKSMTLLVPDDAEDGGEALDVLLTDLGLVLDIPADRVGRYYIISYALAYAMQDLGRFTDSMKGIGG